MAVKKEPSERRSKSVEVEVSVGTQTAAARRSAEAEVSALIDKFAPAHLRLVSALRKWLQPRHRTAADPEYAQIASAIARTIEIMTEIDQAMEQSGG